MHNTAHITLTIEENVVEKLADLAGGESESPDTSQDLF